MKPAGRMHPDFDVTVVGSGPAGLACALSLQQRHQRVRVLTRTHRLRRPAELLAPPTLRALRKMGVDVTMRSGGALPCIKTAAAWSGESPEVFDYQLFMREAGMCVDRAAFDAMLLEATRSAGVELCEHNQHQLHRTETGWQVTTPQEQWTSTWIVDASGRHGASSLSRDRRYRDRMVAIYAPWSSASNQSWLRLHATDGGWWYVMPGADASAHAVFMTDADLVPASRAARIEWLHAAFKQATSIHGLGSGNPDFSRHRATDARSSRARTFAADGMLLVGDAAWSNDPLSGRGIALALEQAKHLVSALAPADSGTAPSQAVRHYRQWCETECGLADRARLDTYAGVNPSIKHHPFWHRRVAAANPLQRIGMQH